jgi:hypothetical protein
VEWVHTVDDLRNDILGYTVYVDTYHQSLFVSLPTSPQNRDRIEKEDIPEALQTASCSWAFFVFRTLSFST